MAQFERYSFVFRKGHRKLARSSLRERPCSEDKLISSPINDDNEDVTYVDYGRTPCYWIQVGSEFVEIVNPHSTRTAMQDGNNGIRKRAYMV